MTTDTVNMVLLWFLYAIKNKPFHSTNWFWLKLCLIAHAQIHMRIVTRRRCTSGSHFSLLFITFYCISVVVADTDEFPLPLQPQWMNTITSLIRVFVAFARMHSVYTVHIKYLIFASIWNDDCILHATALPLLPSIFSLLQVTRFIIFFGELKLWIHPVERNVIW